MFLKGFFCKLDCYCRCLMEYLNPVIASLIRIEIFRVFFFSGLTKFNDFKTTIFLFEHEYKTTWLPLPPPVADYLGFEAPALPNVFAAYLGTGIELVIPVLLLVGLGGRLPILILFVFNYIAMVSYPFLWTKLGTVGLQNHYFWGALILILLMHGTGKISLDNIICHLRKNSLKNFSRN